VRVSESTTPRLKNTKLRVVDTLALSHKGGYHQRPRDPWVSEVILAHGEKVEAMGICIPAENGTGQQERTI